MRFGWGWVELNARLHTASFRGAREASEPGISRFRVRCFASPRNDGGELSDLPEPQIRRVAAFALGFASITRHRVIGPWQTPIGGLLRGPDQIGRAQEMRQRPCAVGVDVADEAKLTVWF